MDAITPHRIDARGLLCPLPVIRLQDAAKSLPPDTLVELIGTDPGILNDVPAWCRISGHQILESREENGEFHILLKLGE
ncbi:MAG TPA: sulfurtransferase TusA family protein [Methylothermaceae bacterium]|nr:sulfurtransferase TusA family protein [Methylothermaceae bacterium]